MQREIIADFIEQKRACILTASLKSSSLKANPYGALELQQWRNEGGGTYAENPEEFKSL